MGPQVIRRILDRKGEDKVSVMRYEKGLEQPWLALALEQEARSQGVQAVTIR